MVKRRRKKIREMGGGGVEGLMRYKEIFKEMEEDRGKKKV